MISTVACIGFTDPAALAAVVREHGRPLHDLSSTLQWVDSSGATVLFDQNSQATRPAVQTEVRTPYTDLVALESGLAQARLYDQAGGDIGMVTVMPAARYTVGWAAQGRMALIALGLDVEFFETVEDFFDSPRSAMPGSETEPPPEVRQFGLPWPPPMELGSFLPAEDVATATFTGTVQRADVRTNTRTGHEFLVARVATLFGELDVCTPVPVEGAPTPGAVVVGQVELLATLPPHGLPDEAVYDAPAEHVEPASRMVEDVAGGGDLPDGSLADFVDISMPDGLVLGSDGVVRTEEEHRAWLGSSATSAPASPPAGQDAPAAESSTPAPDQPTTSDADADKPHPGETRREWRARTGRA